MTILTSHRTSGNLTINLSSKQSLDSTQENGSAWNWGSIIDSRPNPEDITDQVCLAIEQDAEWRARFDNLVLHYSSGSKKGKDIVNSSIGFYVKDLTGMVNIGEGKTAKSELIDSFSQLGYPE